MINYEVSRLKVPAQFVVRVEHNDKMYDLDVVIVKTEKSRWSVLGLPSCIRIDLVKRVDNISQNEGKKWTKEYEDALQ